MTSNKIAAQTWPPLGQVTTCTDPPSSLTAILQVPAGTPREQCQVSLIHSIDGSRWTEEPLSAAPDSSFHHLSLHAEATDTFYFVTKFPLRFSRSLQFTLKFRLSHEVGWRWIRDEHHIDDGHILVLPSPSASIRLKDVLPDLHPAWKVKSRISQSPGTQLWSLSMDVISACWEDPGFLGFPIGKPWSSFLRWFGLVRTSSAWLAPRQGRTKCILDKNAQLLSFMSNRGQSMAILPVCQTNVVPVLYLEDGDRVGVIVWYSFTQGQDPNVELTFFHIQVSNDSEKTETVTVLVAVGNSFENVIATVMYEARGLVENRPAQPKEFDDMQHYFSNTIRPGCEGPWYDGLGYCTWNSLGQQLTEQKLLDALDDLKANDIQISNLIIDDNWQSLDRRGRTQFQYKWLDFEADADAFPGGLKTAVSKIKGQHPNIRNVSVWHAIIGYWGGMSGRGMAARGHSMTTTIVRREGDTPDMVLNDSVVVVAKPGVHRLYLDFYKFLAECGIDGTKVDAQFMLDMMRRAPERRDLTETYLDAWKAASSQYFGFKTISCMSMIPQSIFHALLPRDQTPIQLRNSDDYFPHVPTSHPWHVWTNAHNAILTQYLNVIPDWDMFQTKMDFSAFHAAARCISGGPIYITDVPGQHNLDLIAQITARTVSGDTIVLRPAGFARALHSYNGYEDNLLLKVGTYHGKWGTGISFIALFNISHQPLTELIHLSSFPGTIQDHAYVIRAYTTGKISAPLKLKGAGNLPSIVASINVGGFEILSAFPVVSFADSSVSVANLGLVRKMTGGAAVDSTKIELRDNKSISILTELKALGVLGLYISALPSMTIHSNLVVLLNDRMVPEDTVSVSPDEPTVLEVDTETAWKKMGLEPGNGDRVRVNIICPS